MNTGIDFKKAAQIGIFGFIIWVIPFGVAFCFLTDSGTMSIDKIALNTFLLLITTIIEVILTALYLTKLKDNFVKESIWLGLSWVALNWLLDIIVWVPLAKLNYIEYFTDIGLRYLTIPMITIMAGFILQKSRT